jgi:glycosyltransferase involved in cell wall biosynthesis
MPKQPHVVWVCNWYPHEGEPYAGDFIQRHAKATAIYLPITTFCCFSGSVNKTEVRTDGMHTEHIIYFKTVKTGIERIDKIIYWGRWYNTLKQHLRQYFIKYGKPDLLHCHIILNSGWLGLWAKKKFRIPYILTEHWSGYMPGAINGFDAYNPWSKRLFRKILHNASVITGVSKALIEILQKSHPQGSYIHLPNVVDETIFNFETVKKKDDVFRIIHISTFSAQKNMEDIFRAFDLLAAKNTAVEFHIVGPQERIVTKWKSRKFGSSYVFHSEMPQEQLARLLQACDVCVLYSHYETFGCVIIEANAVGLPVVVSDIPVLRELVSDNKNGILVPPANPSALEQALSSFATKFHSIDAAEVSQTTIEKFSFSTIGQQIFQLYCDVIEGKI